MAKLGLFFFLFGFIRIFTPSLQAQSVCKELKSGWEFRQYNLGEWLPATVPGTVHTDLLANKKIEDPFYRTQEKELQWIDKVLWEYRTEFSLEDSLAAKGRKRLVFYGLDTYAEIFLNEERIGSTDNMFRTWTFDLSDKLRKGKNSLRILFRSPTLQGLKDMTHYGLKLPADNDQSFQGGWGDNKMSVFTRKAPYHYGWDWGPRLVTSGIWRPVVLEFWDGLKVEDLFIRQEQVQAKAARLKAEIRIYSEKEQNADLTLSANDDRLFSRNVRLVRGENRLEIPFVISNPRLWWCNGLGEPHLYTFLLRIEDAQHRKDRYQVRTGLRSLRLVRKPDARGETFYFELNGRPVFAKGANYIPNDVFLPRVTPEDYRKVIADAAEAHMNMIRIWGGGIYEDDYFYRLCDENGIMVWQDFMFACAMYPGSDDFLENVRKEAEENVIRLRNHPCIALWCGNNEIGVAWREGAPGGWGWKQRYTPEEREKIFAAYKALFHRILPEVVNRYTDGDDYWPSSPMAGSGETDFEIQPGNRGDNHYWGVWHGKHRLEEYARNVGRFVSEYGFQSFPDFHTVQTYTLPEDYDISSEVMASHQRSGIGNLRIKEYMGWYYTVPRDFEQFLYMSQVLQARAMRLALQAHRRAMPYCMGSLIWQLNDCWPVASWSTTDYYHHWKAAHYAIRESCKTVIQAPEKNGDTLKLWVVNDSLRDIKGSCTVELLDFNGNRLNKITRPFQAASNASTLIATVDLKDFLQGRPENETFALLSIKNKHRIWDEQTFYFVLPKDLRLLVNPEISVLPIRKGDQYYVQVSTRHLALDVLFYSPERFLFFEKNYMDLIPGKMYTIPIRDKISADEVFSIKTRYVNP